MKSWVRSLFALSIVAIPSGAYAQTPTATDASSLGLGTLIRPLKLEQLTVHEQAQLLSQECKGRVHFFIINGIDPLYTSNLNGAAAYFRSIGFCNTSCHQITAGSKVRRQIEAVRRSDPEARIVLLGYSLGANVARSLANNMQRDGIHIDCLIYLGGDTILNTASSKPANVGRIVNITGHGALILGRDLFFKGEEIEGAVNHRVDARHITLPAQTETVQTIGTVLIAVANPRTPTPTATPTATPTPTPTPIDIGTPAPVGRNPQ